MRQRDIVQQNVESSGTASELVSHQTRDILTLRDELRGVELRNYRLENLIHDGWQHTLVVVGAEGTVDLGKSVDAWPREHTAGDVDHLKIFCASKGGDVARFGADIIVYGCFEPWDTNMCAFDQNVSPSYAHPLLHRFI